MSHHHHIQLPPDALYVDRQRTDPWVYMKKSFLSRADEDIGADRPERFASKYLNTVSKVR
jgi:hypothetical protein